MHANMSYVLGTALIAGLALPGLAFGQAEQPGQAQQPPPPTADQAEAGTVTGLATEAELVAVDLDQSFFLAIGEDGQEMLFHFDAQTEVVSDSDGVQGLTGEAGTRLRIQYRAEGTRAIAERIEMLDRLQEPEAPAPGGESGPAR